MKAHTIRISKAGMGNPKGILVLFCACLLCAYRNLKESSAVPITSIFADAFVAPSPVAFTGAIGGRARKVTPALSVFGDNNNNDDDNDDETSENDINKFDTAQRIESLKSVVLGALSGGIAVTPIAYLHYVATSPVANTAQWEFVTDMSSLQAALFAIVYRYAVRANDNNPMLNQGVVGGFVVVRTLSNIHVTDTCLSIPLRCGPPLGYFDWNMIQQAAWGGVESAFLFGGASLAMELAFRQKWISKFD